MEDTVGKMIFNFNDLARKNNKSELIDKLKNNTCCDEIDDKFKMLGHVLTTDGSVIGPNWANLLKKGSKYRPVSNNIQYLKKRLLKLFEINNGKLLEKLSEPNRRLLLTKIDSTFIHYLQHNDLNKWRHEWRPSDEEIKSAKARFTMVPLDKAVNNISIVCKNFYASLLAKNFGLTLQNGTLNFKSTGEYQLEDITVDKIFTKQVQIYHALKILPPLSDNCRIPNVYGTVKFHKFPKNRSEIKTIKMRYITSGCRSYTVEADEILKLTITHIAKHFAARNKFNWKYFGAKNLKSPAISSSEEAIEFINEINQRHTPTRILSLDVSGMFSAMHHDNIIKAMDWLCDRMLTGNNKYITLEKGYTRYTTERSNRTKWGKTEIMTCLKLFLRDFYTDFCGLRFRTIRGYAMGTKSAPVVTSATLSVQEFIYFSSPAINLEIGYKRYCDDIFFCGTEDIENIAKLIYSNEIVLERDPKENGLSVNFLDLTISIENNSLNFTAFDKRDLFNFKAKKLVEGTSNIPENIKKSMVYSETLRLLRRNNTADGCVKSLRNLRRTCWENRLVFDLQHIFYKILSKQAIDILKYRIPIEHIITSILASPDPSQEG